MTYLNDSSLQFWKNNIDVYDLYKDRARRRDDMIVMRGTFQPALLNDYTYSHIFEPNDEGEPTFVVPVFDQHGIIDILAVSYVWGCVTGHAQYIGTLADPLRVHRTPISWIASDTGILPLAKACYPLMRLADSIVADDAEHAA